MPHGLVNYYFRSKEDLFRQVIERRVGDIAELLVRNLSAALERDEAGAARVRSIVDAYLRAHFELTARGEGETNYMRLTQQLIAFGKGRELIDELAKQYEWVADRYRAALCEALPQADAEFVNLRLHFMRLVLAGVIVDDKLPSPLSLDRAEVTIEILGRYCTDAFLAPNALEPRID